ncbi:unnamed protein product [Symbiodinium sp. CCMP2592]|nr:unnamed protein product [Symbiodinium sp. CCMP2592]
METRQHLMSQPRRMENDHHEEHHKETSPLFSDREQNMADTNTSQNNETYYLILLFVTAFHNQNMTKLTCRRLYHHRHYTKEILHIKLDLEYAMALLGASLHPMLRSTTHGTKTDTSPSRSSGATPPTPRHTFFLLNHHQHFRHKRNHYLKTYPGASSRILPHYNHEIHNYNSHWNNNHNLMNRKIPNHNIRPDEMEVKNKKHNRRWTRKTSSRPTSPTRGRYYRHSSGQQTPWDYIDSRSSTSTRRSCGFEDAPTPPTPEQDLPPPDNMVLPPRTREHPEHADNNAEDNAQTQTYQETRTDNATLENAGPALHQQPAEDEAQPEDTTDSDDDSTSSSTDPGDARHHSRRTDLPNDVQDTAANESRTKAKKVM